MSGPSAQKTVGIVVGGGPAPGLNGVIQAVTIAALNSGHQVLGIVEGFKHLATGAPQFVPLTMDDVSRIHVKGGTVLKTSRVNPTRSPQMLSNTVDALQKAGITHLISIGGDDTAFSAHTVSQYAQRERGYDLRSVHVPKTIDNDLPLPEGIPTFGYETARELGAQLVSNIMEDAYSTQRWYIIVAMGRNAGFLALGIGSSAGATLTLIPEEWRGERTRLRQVGDIIATSIIKRLADGYGYGVAVLAEGVMELIDEHDFGFLETIERDEHGHARLAEVNSAAMIKHQVRDILGTVGVQMTLVDKEIGYELRCADPCAFDIEYTRTLGQAAVDFLNQGGTNALITLQNGRVVPIPYHQLMDPVTGRTGVRIVNIDSLAFQSARRFMVRLEQQDVQDPERLARMAAQTKLSPGEFMARFGYLVGAAPRPF